MHSPLRLRRTLARYLKFLMLLFILRLLLLNEEEEEEEEEEDDFGSAAKNPPKPIRLRSKNYARYLGIIDDSIVRHSQLAGRRRLRYLAFTFLSIVSAAAVPVAVSASLPGWITATLGAVAASSQLFQQVLNDGRLATAHHMAARRLSNARRRFLIDLEEEDETTATRRFVERCEAGIEEDAAIFAKHLEEFGRTDIPTKHAPSAATSKTGSGSAP